MVFVILLIVLVVLILGAVLIRRKNQQRGFSYVPAPNLPLGGSQTGMRPGPGAIAEVALATPEYQSEKIVHDETASDVSDDLLDPRNPRHAEWVKNHPEMATDAEWVAEHPEDNPS